MNRYTLGDSPSRWMTAAAGVVVLILTPVFVFSVDEPSGEIDPGVLDRFQRLSEQISPREWENEYSLIESVITNIWQRNGWRAEPDRFARDTACEVAAVPPWEPAKRINLFSKRIEKRYGLSGENAARLRKAIMREACGFLMRNIGVILDQAGDGMQAGTGGEPFTAEQIARWAKESQPLFAELSESAARLASELEPMLEPAKRSVLKRDLQSFESRQRAMHRIADRWARGEWRPADWGLQDDRGHSVASTEGRPRPPPSARKSTMVQERGRPTMPGRVFPHDPSTWVIYVLDFQKRFDLDLGQMSTAESIHTELSTLANHYINAHTDMLKTISLVERMSHEAYEPVRSLFREFRSRLDAIPTSRQRELIER